MVTWERYSAGQDTLQSTVLDDAGAPGPIVETGDLSGRFVQGVSGHRALVANSDTEIVIARLDDAGAIESVERVTHSTVNDVRAAFGDDGRMTVTWETEPVWGESIVNAFRTDAQGEAGPIREVFPDRQTLGWDIAVDSQGRTAVARLATGRMELVTLDPSGVPGPVTQVADYQGGFPTVAVDAQDRPTIVWPELRLHEDNDPDFVRMRRVEIDGTIGPIHTLVESADRFEDVHLVGVDFDATGGGTVLVELETGSIAATRIAPDGTPGPLRPVAPPANAFSFGVDDLGRTRLTWEREGRIETVLLDPDGNPGAVRTITELGASPNQWSRGGHVDMVVDSLGRATVAWTESPADGPNGNSGPIRAIRIAADGSFGQIHTISPGDQSPPRLGLDGPPKQKLRRSVSVSTTCDEFCRYSATGHVEVLKRRDGKWTPKAKIPLRSVENTAFEPLNLLFENGDFARAKRALKRGRWLVATVEVQAEDRAGLTDSATQEIRLKRRAPKAR
jgi:hypothetical protein